MSKESGTQIEGTLASQIWCIYTLKKIMRLIDYNLVNEVEIYKDIQIAINKK